MDQVGGAVVVFVPVLLTVETVLRLDHGSSIAVSVADMVTRVASVMIGRTKKIIL